MLSTLPRPLVTAPSPRAIERRPSPTWRLPSVIVALALFLRLLLVALGWPTMDSDEGTMGLEALHILQRGEHPIFLYGQNYMGTAEAYLGAFFYHFLGVSLFALRLGMLLLFGLFLVGAYVLARMLYGKGVALVSLTLLGLGAYDVLREQLMAVGGVAETLVCGSFLCVAAIWLARTAATPPEAPAPRAAWRRRAAYAGWGLVAGLGLWSHLLVVPFVVMSGLLLLLFCRHELRSLYGLALVLGLLLGGMPLIIYNLHAPAGQNSLAVFLQIHQYQFPGAPTGPALLIKQITGTVLWSVPLATGMSELWPLSSLPLYGAPSQISWSCLILQGGWGIGYLSLLIWATVVAGRAWLGTWRLRRGGEIAEARAQEALVTQTARVFLLVAAWLTLSSYMFSEIAAEKPWSYRYLAGLLIATPALLWPLLKPRQPGAHAVTKAAILHRRVARPWRAAVLALIFVGTGAGTVYTFSTIPAAQAQNAQEVALAKDLLHAGMTRIYSGYWVCDRLIFQSDEQIICSVVSENMQPGLNRYQPYQATVAASPTAAYVFPAGSAYVANFPKDAPGGVQHYQQRSFDGYVAYIPITAPSAPHS